VDLTFANVLNFETSVWLRVNAGAFYAGEVDAYVANRLTGNSVADLAGNRVASALVIQLTTFR
jgi:hypothetical protein